VREACFASPEGDELAGGSYEPLSAVAVALLVAITVALGVAGGPVLTWLGVQ